MSPVGGAYDVTAARSRFGALDGTTTFLDTPGGSQVPDAVTVAVADAMRHAAANLGGVFETSRRVAAIVADARAAAGRFLGCSPDEAIFGQNMTSLNFALTRVMARELQAGDEILVTRLDHDASVSPWLAVAEDVGAVVRTVEIDEATCTLDLADLEAKLGERTRVVSFSWAANSVGTLIDPQRVCELAHEAGALAWIDATHAAAHVPVAAEAIGADVLVCSPYKFCGPHLGLAYGRADVVAGWRPYKVRPAPDAPVGSRFETGTQPYEQLAGFAAAVRYWEAVDAAGAGHEHARALGERFLAGLPAEATLVGPPTMEDRVPTFLLRFADRDAGEVADALVARRFAISASDSFYCLGLRELIGPRKALRVGLFHYTTDDEVDGVLAALRDVLA
ncbi:MAG TPA: aminotransferase class V-fold PLP-dependent enzyme [Baekduia sp.]|nr:aminotransferase class V-fold PLP-dependent enzyme [Baekduia sp.]